MITQQQLESLRALFKEDGIEISDGALLECGLWLLARAKSVSYRIPREHLHAFEAIKREAVHPHVPVADNQHSQTER